MVRVRELVVDPAALATLHDESCPLEQLQVAADVGLGLAGGIDQLTYAQAARRGEEAAREPHADAVPQRGEEAVGIHIYNFMNMMSPVNPLGVSACRRVKASASMRLGV